MSLLNGMNDMLVNEEAMESALDAEMFNEYLALEADELIDVMVDADDEFDDDEDLLDDDEDLLDEYDNDDIATEKAGSLTGSSFLASLMHNDDPIKTKDGTIGVKDSGATFGTNFSSGARNTTDPQKTRDGAIGSNANTAAFSGNYSHTAEDKAIESALFFEDLMGEDDAAMEGVISKLKEKRAAKMNLKRQENCKFAGVRDIDKEKLQALINENKFDEAIKMVSSFGKYLESSKGKFGEDDPEAVKKCKVIDRMIKTNTSLMMKLIEDKKTKEYINSGMDAKAARKKARKDSKAKASNSADKATESYLNECVDMMEAFESTREDLVDTAVGDGNGTASPNNNFSDGLLDDTDPIKTKNGSIGSDKGLASFDENFTDADLDRDDPIVGKDGSVGKDAVAKDPTLESTLDEELAFLNDALFDDFEDFE